MTLKRIVRSLKASAVMAAVLVLVGVGTFSVASAQEEALWFCAKAAELTSMRAGDSNVEKILNSVPPEWRGAGQMMTVNPTLIRSLQTFPFDFSVEYAGCVLLPASIVEAKRAERCVGFTGHPDNVGGTCLHIESPPAPVLP